MRRLVVLLLIAPTLAVLPQPAQAAPTEQGVLVLKYFPLTADGQHIDPAVTGDVNGTLADLRAKTTSITTNAAAALSRGTRHRGHSDPAAQPSLTYRVIDVKEELVAVPTVANPH